MVNSGRARHVAEWTSGSLDCKECHIRREKERLNMLILQTLRAAPSCNRVPNPFTMLDDAEK